MAEDLERMYKYFTICQQPVKFEATLYHYRVRETSVTQDDNYRKKAVEDLPVVLNHLAEWIRKNDIKAEPWLDLRLIKLFQNLLYSASQVRELEMRTFLKIVNDIVNRFKSLGFPFTQNIKVRLAVENIKLYFLLNKIYLRLSGLQ